MSEQDKAPDAPAQQPDAASEANSTNSNLPADNSEQKPSADQPSAQNGLGLTAEQADEFNRFMQANGGFEKAFGLVKRNISAPKNNAPETPQQPAEQPSAPQTQNVPQQPGKGQLGMEALLVQQYMNNLASEEKYAGIADDIRNGNLMKEMSEGAVPIFPVTNGAINDAQIRWYLDMKAAGVAATQTSAAPTTTPTVDYVDVETVKSYDDAAKIIMQNQALRAAGRPEHPKTEEAKKFIQEYMKRK